MLFFAGFADGKLQGMCYSKFLSLGGLVVILSWFVKEPLQYVFGIFLIENNYNYLNAFDRLDRYVIK